MEGIRDAQFLVGDEACLAAMERVPVLPAFSQPAIEFLSGLSQKLRRDPVAKEYGDILSYAYWIRRASLEQAKEACAGWENRLGRGIAFHITPSNVPVNFAVSLTSSLLAGNCTVVRVSDKVFQQVGIICGAINQLLEGECAQMKPYLCILRYGHQEEATRALSDMCSIRIIWGGDQTIEAIRQIPIPPRAKELTFADRFSLVVIHADQYLKKDPRQVAKGFYTDTYYTDQNACSSPRMVVWMGTEPAVKEAKRIFWKALEDLAAEEYPMRPVQAVDKFTSLCMLGMSRSGVRLRSKNTYVMRAELESLTPDLSQYFSKGGLFYEYTALRLEELLPVLTERCQTVSVLGVEKEAVLNLVFANGVRGVDRIVNLGETMTPSFIWDGYKMIEEMSRYVFRQKE